MSDREPLTDEQQAALDKLKADTPWIFPEWERLQQAQRRLEQSQKNLAQAQAAWDNLGDPVLDPASRNP